MKRILMLSFGLGAAMLLCSHAVHAQDKGSGKFGVSEGKPVDKGVVFVDGQFLTSPYVVSRRGLALYVNDREITRPRRHMQTAALASGAEASQLPQAEQQRLCRALDGVRAVYEDSLHRGGGYLFTSKGQMIELSPYVVAYKLPGVVNLLQSNLAREEKIEKLRSCGWYPQIDVDLLVDRFISSDQLQSQMAQQAMELLRIDEFGVGESISVSEGFVFWNGVYVEAPYILQRRGAGLYLNDQLIVRPPQQLGDVPSDGTDPKMPSQIDAETSWFDSVVVEYLAHKGAYLSKQYPPEEARKRMAEAVAALPLVTKTQREDATSSVLRVTTLEGATISYELSPSRGRGGTYERASVVPSLQRQLDYFQESLTRGSCHLLFDGGSQICLPAAKIDRTLPWLVGVARSNKVVKAKQTEIKQLCAMSESMAEKLARGFSPSQQLDSRLAALVRKNSQK